MREILENVRKNEAVAKKGEFHRTYFIAMRHSNTAGRRLSTNPFDSDNDGGIKLYAYENSALTNPFEGLVLSPYENSALTNPFESLFNDALARAKV